MIKIINGVFGYNNGTCVIPVTPKDKPISCPEEIEKRLVEQGVAEYVEAPKTEPLTGEGTGETENNPVPQTHDDLVKQAKELGIGGNLAAMKDDTLIKKINEAIENKCDETDPADKDGEEETEVDVEATEANANNEAETNDGENAPELDNVDGVVG